MSYMCTDSGNLMAIAQQVIQQKQKQQQRHQQHESVMASSVDGSSGDGDPFSSAVPSQWGQHHHHQSPSIRDHFPFALTEPGFHDPFAAGVLGFHAPPHLEHAAFRISDFGTSAASEFDSDEWMDSLIGESPTGSSEIMADVWKGTDLPPIFSDAFPTCSAAVNLSTAQASSSDLDRVVFSDSCKIVVVPPALPAEPPKKDAAAESNRSSPPLFKSLLECAQIVDSDPDLAEKAIARIRDRASKRGEPTERVAFYFSEALSRRVAAGETSIPDVHADEDLTLCYKSFNEACPFSMFIHLTANQAILEATESADKIHIIDFGIDQGIQWAPLLQALATRPTGKPSRIRISGIPAISIGSSPASPLAATGNRLLDFARVLDLNFEFEPILDQGDDLSASSFRVEPGEAVAVNFTLQLNRLLDDDGDEAVEKAVRLAKSVRPSVVTLGEYECSLNRAGFVERFGSALRYFAAVFESVEAAMERESVDRGRLERVLLGPRILGAVGPGGEGERRVRMEGRDRWRVVMEGCGLEIIGVSNYAVSQAKLLLWNYEYSPKYSVLDTCPGFLSLAWDDLPIFTVSSWR